MTHDNKFIIAAMCENMYLQMTYFPKHLPGHEVVEHSDLTLVYSCIANNTFNSVLRAHLSKDTILKRIQEVKAFYAQRAVPFAWWIGPLDEPYNISEYLLSQGFIKDEQECGMVLPLNQYQPDLSTNFVVERVLDTDSLRLFDQVHVISGFTQNAFEKRFGLLKPSLYQDGSPIELYVGRIDGFVVATGMLVFHANVAGIYYLATIPEQRRKGYGTAMMYALLVRAKARGYVSAVLQASEMGRGVYKKLGFREVCTFNVYI